MADSISVNMPSDGLRALRAATQTEGAYIAVEDQKILEAISDLGAVGIFAEPAGATALAGLKAALQEGLVSEDGSHSGNEYWKWIERCQGSQAGCW